MATLNPLEFGHTGAEVADLHQALELLGFAAAIPDDERAEQRYGEGTRDAVARLQRHHGWNEHDLGLFDARCAARVNELITERLRKGEKQARVRWNPFKVPKSAASPDSRITALSRRADNLETWSFGSGDAPQGGFWYSDGTGWREPYLLPGPVGSPMSGIAALSRKSDTMETWWIAPDGSVNGANWYDAPEGDRRWHPYPDPVAGVIRASTFSGIAAVSREPKRMEIWWIGIDGSVQGSHWYEDDVDPKKPWRPYAVAPGQLFIASRASGIAAVSRTTDNMEIWWVGQRGSVEGAFWYDDGAGWRRYQKQVAPDNSAAEAHCIAAVSRSSTSMDVVWVTPRGEVQHAYWNQGQEWKVNPQLAAGLDSALPSSGVALVSRSADSLEVFWVRPGDDSVQGARWDSGAGWQAYPGPVAGRDSVSTSSGIAATLRKHDKKTDIAVTWVGTDFSVQGATTAEETSGPDWVVHGIVRKDGGPHPARLTVRAFNRNVSGNGIGMATTGADGSYRISYKKPSTSSRSERSKVGDFALVVAAFAGDDEVVRSALKPAPGPIEEINLDVVSDEWMVRGVVEDPSGRPLSGVSVIVADRDLGLGSGALPVEELGRGVSGSDGTAGGFLISYRPSQPGEGTRDGRWSPDLVFRLHSGGAQVQADVYRYVDGVRPVSPLNADELLLGIEATPSEHVVLRITTPLPPVDGIEFDTLDSAMRALLPAGSHPGMLNEELHRDISFTARELGRDPDLVTMIAAAYRTSHNDFRDVPPDILYGLARSDRNLGTVSALAHATREQLIASVRQAIDRRVIKPRDDSAIYAAVDKIRAQAPDGVLDGADGGPAYKQVLDVALGQQSRPLQQAFLRHAAGNEDNPKAMWDALLADANLREKVPRIQLTLQLDALTGRHTKLMQAIADRHGVVSARDLLTITAADFKRIIGDVGEDVPDDLPGNTVDEKAGYWAAGLAANVHQAFPTLSVARSVKNAPPMPDVEISDEQSSAATRAIKGASIQDVLATVLERAADIGDDTTAGLGAASGEAVATAPLFDIGRSRMDAFVTKHETQLFKDIPDNPIGLHDAVKQELDRTQRLYRVSTSPAAMDWLLAKQYRSAFEIAMTPVQSFVEAATTRTLAGGPKLPDAEAIMVHSRARAIANSVMATHLHISDARFAAGVRALNNAPTNGSSVRAAAANVTGGPGGIDTVTGGYLPSWVKEFGSANYCACAECQSIYSPAAYLVTLLDFLDAFPNAQGTKPLDVLLTRRPDLESLLLTCENTNTQLPYVDLVNRVLESLVKYPNPNPTPPVNPDRIPAYDIAGATSAELAAAPQNTDWYAYLTEPGGTKRPDRAAYPNRLPFDAALHAIRGYLAHLSVPYTLLLKTFDAQARVHALTAEYLQLAPATFELITGMTLDDEPVGPVGTDERYGFDVEPPESLELDRSKGRQVWALKKKLNAAGANPLLQVGGKPSDEEFKQKVFDAVTSFQATQALPTTGRVDAAVWKALIPYGPSLLSLLLPHVPTFLHRASVTYAELVELLKMRFINPQRDIYDIVLRLKLPAQPLIDWIKDQLQGPVPAALIPPLDAAKVSAAEFRAWAMHVFGESGGIALRHTIVVFNPNPAACDLESSVIRYWSDDDPDVSDTDWLRLDRLIRLWRATGWTHDDLDLALTALEPDDGELDASVIKGIARIAELATALELSVPQVVLLFSDLDPSRPTSLYHKVFRNRASRHIDPVFDPDWKGEVLRDATIGKQLAALQSGLRVGDADMAALRAKLNLTEEADELTVIGVSAMLRYVTLARALGLNVRDLLTMLTAVNGNSTLPTNPPTGASWPLRDFINEVQRLSLTELNVAQLNNIIAPIAALPPSTAREQLLTELASRLRAIDEDLSPSAVLDDDVLNPKAAPREALTRRMLAMLEQPDELVDAVILIVTGRDRTTTVVEQKLTPPPVIPDDWQTRLEYRPHDPDEAGLGSALVTCIGALTDDERDEVKTFSNDARWIAAVDVLHAAPRTTLTKLVTGLADVEVTAPAPAALLANPLRDDPAHPEYREADIAARLKKLLNATVPVVRDQARQALINQMLLAVVPDATTLALLLTEFRGTNVPVLPASTPNKPLIDDLMRLGNGVITTQAHQAYELLSRAQRLVDGLTLNGAELNVLVTKVISLRANAAHLMTYADIGKVSAYARVRDQLGAGAERLPEVLRAADEDKARATLAELLAVPTTVITDIVVALKGGSLRLDPLLLERVAAAVKVVVDLGVSVSAAVAWLHKPATPPTVDEVRTMVDEIRRAVKARYEETAWLEVAKALHDPQRDARRAALVDYLVARLDWLISRNPDGLYQRLYLQVEMSSCMKTSPIRLAIDSVHTFIHRCLLGLEKPAVDPDQIDEERWQQVLHSQQLWRADVEVLVNPENYILPELRDDKSPAFMELEGALLSEDLTEDAAERAIAGYLEKADSVARLDVIALHVQRGFEPGEKLQAVAHVVGRSANVPYKHYYRRLVVTDTHTEGWTPWEEVPVDIRGDLVTMVTFERRLYLFWVLTNTKTKEQAQPQGVQGPRNPQYEQEVEMCWSEYRNGAWGPKNVTDASQVLKWDYLPEPGPDGGTTVQGVRRPKGLIERLETKVDGDRLHVSCIRQRGQINIMYGTNPANPSTLWTTQLQTFVLDGCHGQLRAERAYAFADTKGSYFLFEDKKLRIRALAEGGLAPATVLNTAAELLLGEEDWMHLGADYFAIGDDERVYFGALRRHGPELADILFRPERMFPMTKDLRIRELKFADALPNLADIKRVADRDSRPWAGYSSAVAQFARIDRPGILSAAVTAVDEVGPRDLVKIDFDSINFARAGVFDVGIKAMFPRQSGAEIVFETFYDPFVCTYLKRMRQYGIPGLLTLANQQLNTQQLTGRTFESKYQPNKAIVKLPFPTEKVDFGFSTPGVYRANAYAVTNRELFIEIPMLLAKRFRENRRFEESLRYLKYVWDFTNPAGDYWRAEPLRLTPKESVEKWLTRLKDGDPELLGQIDEWRKHPFQPHFVARMRPSAYQRYVVMECLDTLLEWGDAEFRRDTMESLTKAAQLYVLVADLLGARPEAIPTGTSKPKTFKDMRSEPMKGLAIVSAEFENIFPSMSSSTVSNDPDTVGLLGISKSLYFCVPPNQKLLAYWDTVADRLFKIRHCMNIEGIVRELPLFEPRIDPALLVRAAAQGIDTSAVIAEAGAPLPPYRFEVALRRALEACGAVTRLGAQLLSAIERGDAEKLAALNASQSTAALNATLLINKQQEEAADAQVAALQTSRDVPVQRLMYYQFLMGVEPKAPQPGDTIEMLSYAPKPQSAEGTWLIQEELDELGAMHSARDWQVLASTTQVLASGLSLIPSFSGHVEPFGCGVEMSFGGQNLGAAVSAISQYQSGLASQDQYIASHAGRMAAHRRRGQEFAVNANTAAREVMNIDKQITSAMISKEIARLERKQIELQIEQAEAIDAHLGDKFTNTKLYGLLQSKLSSVYAQFYKLAYDLAKQAERCYRFRYPELTDGAIIQAGNWESGRKGLLAGEQLELQLRQLERAYADRDSREFELTKHISLLQHAPTALIKLRETGSAEFELPELLFDLDHPGHYMRRIKSVSLTIPAVVGPYATVNATLTLLSNEIRVKPTLKNQKYERDLEGADDRFVDDFAAIQQIATSSGQDDHGLFELNFRDERFLPFEGAGLANSRWRIVIDPDCNPFDVPDVVMCARFVARQGGDLLRQKAKERWTKLLKDQEGLPLARAISLRHEFPTEWDRLRTTTEPGGEHTVSIALTRDRFPALFRRSNLVIGALDVYGVPGTDGKPTKLPSLRTPQQTPGESVDVKNGAPVGGLLHEVARLDAVPVQTDPDKAEWWLTASTPAQKDSLAKLHDILLVCHYSAKKPQP